MKVALFGTCLAEVMRPGVVRAAQRLLRYAGCEVYQPGSQTCCGQPAWNSGYRGQSLALARKVVAECAACDYVVLPSGSCAGMMRCHYPELGDGDVSLSLFAEKCWELSAFLAEVCAVRLPPAAAPQRITYHDGCAGLREMGVQRQPRTLLRQRGYEVVEMEECASCCGFGGTFAVKFGAISAALAADKCAHILASGCDTVVMGDVGCMLNIEGRLQYDAQEVKIWHVAELLAAGLCRGG